MSMGGLTDEQLLAAASWAREREMDKARERAEKARAGVTDTGAGAYIGPGKAPHIAELEQAVIIHALDLRIAYRRQDDTLDLEECIDELFEAVDALVKARRQRLPMEATPDDKQP